MGSSMRCSKSFRYLFLVCLLLSVINIAYADDKYLVQYKVADDLANYYDVDADPGADFVVGLDADKAWQDKYTEEIKDNVADKAEGLNYSIVDEIPEHNLIVIEGNSSLDALRKNRYVDIVEEDAELVALKQYEGWNLRVQKVEEVHNAGINGQGVRIAIFDTGVDYADKELSSSYAGGYDYVNNDNQPLDDEGHGTAVASVIFAKNNAEGVYGIAPNAKFYALKILDEHGSGSISTLVKALDFVEKNDADILVFSLGTPHYSAVLDKALKGLYDEGIVMVAAVGNEGKIKEGNSNVFYPAKYDTVIAVSGMNENMRISSISSRGQEVEFAAPGEDIYLLDIDGSVYTGTGTSYAAPQVAGIIALFLSTRDVSNVSELREILHANTVDLGVVGKDDLYGYGMIDSAKLFSLQQTGQNPMLIRQPIEKQYNSTEIDVVIQVPEKYPTIYYEDNSVRNVLCKYCVYEKMNDVFVTRKRLAFSEGRHLLKVFNSNASDNVTFIIDTHMPVILKTYPFPHRQCNGTFTVEYVEDNGKAIGLIVNTGKTNGQSLVRYNCPDKAILSQSGEIRKMCIFNLDIPEGYSDYSFWIKDAFSNVSSRKVRIYSASDSVSKQSYIQDVQHDVNGKRVYLNITLGEKVGVLKFFDNGLGREQVLCKNCDGYGNDKERYIYFSKGKHSLTIIAVDGPGLQDEKEIRFTIS